MFAENLLAPPGTWTINITAQRAGAYDAAASFNVNYPQEITESDAHAEDRTFGSFEVIHHHRRPCDSRRFGHSSIAKARN